MTHKIVFQVRDHVYQYIYENWTDVIDDIFEKKNLKQTNLKDKDMYPLSKGLEKYVQF